MPSLLLFTFTVLVAQPEPFTLFTTLEILLLSVLGLLPTIAVSFNA